MDKIVNFLAENNVKVDKETVKLVALKDGLIWVFFDEETKSIKIEIEPYDERIVIDATLADVIGMDIYGKEDTE